MATRGLDIGQPPVISGGSATEPAPSRRDTLFHPVVDFLCLGGASLILLPLLVILVPDTEAARKTVALIALWLAHVLNHPHFAHSYQIFYRDYARKAFGGTTPPALRVRYVIAGIIVPLALVAYFTLAIAAGDVHMIGYAGNIMFFLVGWHYAKQGYGMLMVDAALKRRFFDAAEKKILLINTHVGWVTFWLMINATLIEREMWGIQYFMLGVPDWLLATGCTVFTLTTGATLLMLARKWRHDGTLPLIGITAYVASIYVWLLLRFDPLPLLLIPALHSLQYLTVVWRYQINVETHRARSDTSSASPWRGFWLFTVVGVVLGFAGFWLAPAAIDTYASYDKGIFGGTLFLFVFWMFINVHHYFLDNVMWRRENAETKKHLFG
ncbi:MAG: hypothetical protein V3R85_06800 [Alphaproteobacteria bacterium]